MNSTSNKIYFSNPFYVYFSFVILILSCKQTNNSVYLEYDCYQGELNNPCNFQSIQNFSDVSPNLIATAKEVLLNSMNEEEFNSSIEFIELRTFENCEELPKHAMKYSKHHLYFKRKFKNKAISSYCFKLLMDSNNKFIGSWNLPDINKNHSNKSIISNEKLDRILTSNNFNEYNYISLDFNGLSHHYELKLSKKKDKAKPESSLNSSNAIINIHTGEFNSWEEWDIKTATNLNLIPKFGYTNRTAKQQKTDKKFIENIIKNDSLLGNNSEKLVRLATKSLKEKKDKKGAMYLYNLAYLADSTNTDIYWGYGNIYISLGLYAKAVDQYKIGLKRDSTNSKLLHGYGYWCWLQYDSFKDRKDQNHDYKVTAKSRLNEAISYLTKGHKYNPEDKAIIFDLVSFHLDNNDCSNAKIFYNKVKSIIDNSYENRIKENLEKNCLS